MKKEKSVRAKEKRKLRAKERVKVSLEKTKVIAKERNRNERTLEASAALMTTPVTSARCQDTTKLSALNLPLFPQKPAMVAFAPSCPMRRFMFTTC